MSPCLHPGSHHFVAVLALCGHGAVLGKAGFGVVPAQDGHVCARDAEEAAAADSLHSAVEKRGCGAVGINVHHVEAVILPAVLVHHHAGPWQ